MLLLQKWWERDFKAGWVGKSSSCHMDATTGKNGSDPETESTYGLGGDAVDKKREKIKWSGGKALE